MWEDGSALDYTNWDFNQTIVNKQQPINEDTGKMRASTQTLDLKWKQSECTGFTQKNYFVCHTKKVFNTSPTSVSLSSDSPISVSLTTVSKVSSKFSSGGLSDGKKAAILFVVIHLITFLL